MALSCLSSAKATPRPSLTLHKFEDIIHINPTYQGTDIHLYGSLPAEAYKKKAWQLVLLFSAPPQEAVIEKKERKMGIWKTHPLSTTPPFPQRLTFVTDKTYKPQIHLSPRQWLQRVMPQTQKDEETKKAFSLFAPIAVKQNLYIFKKGTLHITKDGLFRYTFHLPAHFPQGKYTVQAFLLDKKATVLASTSQNYELKAGGLIAFIKGLAHTHPLLYGLVSIFLVAFVGFSMTFSFQWLGRRRP